MSNRSSGKTPPLLVISTGCPAGIGPEVSVAAAARLDWAPKVLVGDETTLRRAAELTGVAQKRLLPFSEARLDREAIYFKTVGPRLSARELKRGAKSPLLGAVQLAYVEAAYALAADVPRRALITGPVSKSAIANSGLPRARRFLGHTEWLKKLDGARVAVMCFASPELVVSLATTHVPLRAVPRRVSARGVFDATYWLAELLCCLGRKCPQLAVASLNPHAGESELLGDEESRAIVPGMRLAQRKLGRRAQILGPIGAETAFRKAYQGEYDGVVAMYHDQATIPLKLVSFGDAVNVTMGLSITRTSVDHGTAYDIAWRGQADAGGMAQALELAARLAGG